MNDNGLAALVSPFDNVTPVHEGNLWVAPGAVVIGRVTAGPDVNIWYGAVVRGDVGRVSIGARTNIQDQSMLHMTTGAYDCVIGADVTVGHRVTLHGCEIADGCLIGMGATVLDGATVGSGSLVAAGSVVAPGAKIPSGVVVRGAPARVVRDVKEEEVLLGQATVSHYIELAQRHAAQINGWRAFEEHAQA